MWLPTDYWKVEKSKFQPQNVPMDISEKNETKAMHKITFRGHQIVLMDKVFHLSLWQQWRFKMAENSIYFANEFGDSIFLAFKHFF